MEFTSVRAQRVLIRVITKYFREHHSVLMALRGPWPPLKGGALPSALPCVTQRGPSLWPGSPLSCQSEEVPSGVWSFGKLREASWTSLLGTCHPLAADRQSHGPPLEGRPSCGRASPGSPGAQGPAEQVHAKLQLVDLAGSECAGEPRAGASVGASRVVGSPECGSRLQ